MPRIGQIEVPDTLWEALVENAAKDFSAAVLNVTERNLPVDLSVVREELGLDEERLSQLYDCVIALVRMQTNDFDSDDNAIEDTYDYIHVINSAYLAGHQIAYQTLSSDNQFKALKTLADHNWKAMNTQLPPPS